VITIVDLRRVLRGVGLRITRPPAGELTAVPVRAPALTVTDLVRGPVPALFHADKF